MKLTTHANEFETNAEVKSQNFGIGNASKIIGILRNFLYEHKVRTMVQEYMSNARDAMREAKSDKRILITVPNQMNPVFKVRDFGPGITPHRMRTVFIQYGESTKENSNKETGGFGIGAKSAWAYTDSFTIVSITGGRKRTYVAHTGVNNQGRLDEISDEPSQDATGTEIHVAVKSGDIENFRRAIWRACYFWTPKEYPEFKGVVKHEIPERQPSIRIGAIELIPGYLPNFLELDSNHYGDYCSMVIDGIPYKLNKQFISGVEKLTKLLGPIKCNALIHVGNGVLDIPATRESVADTEINKEVLNKLAPDLTKGLAEYVTDEFDKAKSYSEWIVTYNKMSKMLNVDNHAKRGDYSINGSALQSKKFKDFALYTVGANYGRRGKGGFKRTDTSAIDLNNLTHVFYVDDVNEYIVTQNRRIQEYVAKSGVRNVILMMPQEKFEMVANPSTNLTTTPVAGKATPGPIVAPPLSIKKVTVTLKQSEKTMMSIIKDLGGKPLSTLPFTPIVREAREKRDRQKEEFTIHQHGYGRKHPRVTTLEKVQKSGDRYLYIEFKEYDKYKTEFEKMKDFVRQWNYVLCALSPKTIKDIKGNKEFTHYDTWYKSYKPSQAVIHAALASKMKNGPEMKLLANASTKIKDKGLAEMLETYKPLLKSNPEMPPKEIEAMIADELKEFSRCDAELTKLIKESYSLLSKIEGTLPSIADEAVAYVNSKT